MKFQYGVHIEAEVVDGALILTHTTENPDPVVINREFDSRMTQIGKRQSKHTLHKQIEDVIWFGKQPRRQAYIDLPAV